MLHTIARIYSHLFRTIIVSAIALLVSGSFLPTFTRTAHAASPNSAAIIPIIDSTMQARLRAIFVSGQNTALGSEQNRADVFAKVGDSITDTGSFLADIGCRSEDLGDYGNLAATVSYFRNTVFPANYTAVWCGTANSFSAFSPAAVSGWTADRALDPAELDSQYRSSCPAPYNTPLACEFHRKRPSIALIMFGTNDLSGTNNPSAFKKQLRRIVDTAIAQHVIPVLSTIPPRLDNLGTRVSGFNQAILDVGSEKQVPVMNYWLSLQGLPNQGIDLAHSDPIHPNAYNGGDASILTNAGLRFGYNMRNLLTLQTLDTLRTSVLLSSAPVPTPLPPPAPVRPPTPSSIPVPTPFPIPVSVPVSLPVTVTLPVHVPLPVTSFRLMTSVNSASFIQGRSVVSTLTLSRLNGFTANPSLSISGLPTGVTARFSRSTLTSTATVTIRASNTAHLGTFPLTIQATSGAIRQTIPFALTINSRTPSYTLSVSPVTASILQGRTQAYVVTATRINGQNGKITIKLLNPPTGLSATTITIPSGATRATLTVRATATAPIRTSTLTIQGVSGALVRTVTSSLRVTTPVATVPARTPTPVPTPLPVPAPTPVPTPTPAQIVSGAYDIGAPTLRDIWVNPTSGSDSNDGSTSRPVRTIRAAWNLIPSGTLTQTGYRLMIKAGTYNESQVPDNSWYEGRRGSFQFPVIFQAADGAGTVTVPNPNFYDNTYLYLIGLRVVTGGGDIVHFEKSSHILLRNITLVGQNRGPQEGLKVNQSQYIYVENSDISGAWDNAIDFVGVQYGHIINNKIHDSGDWCMYTKGGSAYFRIEGNEIYNCGTGGYTAGQGTGYQWMTAPWINYEAYGIKFVNNVIHDTDGAGIGVNGGYNILLANNTMYKVGRRDHVIEVVFGLRGCDGNDSIACRINRNLGGWGPLTSNEDPIPNKNVYIYNNIVLNPAGYQSQWQHFAIYGPRTASSGSGIVNSVRTDTNLQVKGNIIWNGPSNLPLGIEEGDQGCQPSNTSCNATQILRENAINTIQPQFMNPAAGDFRLTAGSNVLNAMNYVAPTFTWNDLPMSSVPTGVLTNTVNTTYNGQVRTSPHAGAY